MSRQPLSRVVPESKLDGILIGTTAIGKRPTLESVICACVLEWPFVEAEMALALGALLGVGHAPALAVFNILRRSSAQRAAISAASGAVLNAQDQELLGAILNTHKAIEGERNYFVHGHFGICDALPDALLWQSTEDYVQLQAAMNLAQGTYSRERHKQAIATIYVYRLPDLETAREDIKLLGLIWREFVQYHRESTPRRRAELYRRLCELPHIAREFAQMRQKNNPSTPLQSHHPGASAES